MKSKSKIKNLGLLKIQKCMNKIINVIPSKSDSLVFIIDQFLKNYKNDYKVNNLLNDLYDILDSTIILDNKNNFMKKKIKYNNENYIKILKKINEGNYGEINSCKINNENVIVKSPKFNEKNRDEVLISFMKENLIHIILFCLQDQMNKCFKIAIVNKCIPEVIDLIKATDENNKKEKLIVIMEKLDYDGWAFFEKKNTYKDELTFIAFVAYNLYFLQNSVKKFIHRDLHCGNIMVKKSKEMNKTNIKLKDGLSFSVDSNYRTYLIDFGMSCFDLASCLKIINMPVSRISSPGVYETDYCDNKGHDLRLFLSSIYFEMWNSISNELKEFLSGLFEKKYSKVEHWHGMYYDVLKMKDVDFYPENILVKIKKELKK